MGEAYKGQVELWKVIADEQPDLLGCIFMAIQPDFLSTELINIVFQPRRFRKGFTVSGISWSDNKILRFSN
jgi:hypothetical protein